MHPRKFIRDSLGFAAAQYLSRVLIMARGVIAARLLGPILYGSWSAIQLLMDYGTLAPLGTQSGLDQAIPGRIVEGDAGRLERMERAGLFNIVALTLFFCALCFAYLIGRSTKIYLAWGTSGVLLALTCMFLTNVAFYHQTLLRSHGNIGAVSTWYFLQGLIGAVLGLSLIPALGVWALLVGWATGTLVATIVVRIQARRIAPIVPRPAPESRTLMAVGLPMFFYLGSNQVMRSFDRIIILKFLGFSALGYYTISVMVLTFTTYLPDSINYVLYPRLLREFQAGERRPEAIRGTLDRSLRGLSVLVPAVCGVAYLLVRETVLTLLPKYAPGLTAARVLCFGAGALAISNLSSLALMTLGRQNTLVPVTAAITLLGMALDYLALQFKFGINGVARATLVTYALNGVTLLWFAWGGLQASRRERAAVVARAFLPLTLAFGLAYGIDKVFPVPPGLHFMLLFARLLAAVVIFGIAYGAAVAPLVRGLGFKRILLEFNLPLAGLLRRRNGGSPEDSR